MIQYQVDFVVTGATKGTSCNRLYQELELEILAVRRWSSRLFFFHKIALKLLPPILKLTIILLAKKHI